LAQEGISQRNARPVLLCATLYSFLVQADPARTWGGLQRIVTPDGNILWLCEAHRQQYEAKPLDPRYMGLR